MTMWPLLIRLLRHPERVPELTGQDWDRLIRAARRTNLLARLAALLEAQGGLDRIPAGPRAALRSALVLARHHEVSVAREVEYLRRALAPAALPLLVLKGTAYALARLPPAAGRLFSDVDILVPKARLAQAEAALMLHGWATTHRNAYDQRYYRRWMHELPPMQHIRRQTTVDVHHNILPETARRTPDAAKLLAAAVPVPEHPQVRMLQPTDMVLHCATHLFHDSEFDHALRDLVDFDALLGHFGAQPEFWPALAARAAELGLARPLYYALRYASALIGTEVPAPALEAARQGEPNALVRRLMDKLMAHALLPRTLDRADRRTLLARQALFLRAHWLRMPPHLLAYHLTVKALRPALADGEAK
jgi:hypothetical protein